MGKKMKLSPIQRKVLTKIKKRQIKNIERPIRIGGKQALSPKGKPLKASFLNIPNKEATTFRTLEKKGLISAFGKTEYYTNFRLTQKGKAQFNMRK